MLKPRLSISKIAGFLLFFTLTGPSTLAQTRSTDLLFDFAWRFHLGGVQGAEAPEFDDSKWRTLDLPHDWGIEDLPGQFTLQPRCDKPGKRRFHYRRHRLVSEDFYDRQ